MFVLIVGNFDLDEAMDTIKDNMDLIDKTSAVTINKKKEAKKVNILEDTLYGDINLEKIGIGLKIHNDSKNKLLTRLYYKMIFNCLLGSTSLFNERVEKLNLVHNFSFDIENYEDIYTLYIINSSNDIDKLLEEVKHEFKSHKIKESDFNRIKKVWIARLVKASDDVFEMIDISYDDIIRYGDIINNKIEIIKNMSYKEMKELLKKIDFDNMSVVRMKRKEN
jgi:predicted Zn-dependent peptidase